MRELSATSARPGARLKAALTLAVWCVAACVALSAAACGEDTENPDEANNGTSTAQIANAAVEPASVPVGATCDPAEVTLTLETTGFGQPVTSVVAFFDDPLISEQTFPLTAVAGQENAWSGTIPIGSLDLCVNEASVGLSVQADDGETSVSQSGVVTLTITETP